MQEITETHRKISAITEADGRYPADAYEFVADAVKEAVRRLDSPRHVSAAELLTVFRSYAHENFGPMTAEVFASWHIRGAADIGRMVYELIQAQLLSASPEDRESDFDIEFDLIGADASDTDAVSNQSSVSWKVPKID